MKDLLTIKEVQALFGWSAQYTYKWLRENPYYQTKIGHRVYGRKEQIEAYIASITKVGEK